MPSPYVKTGGSFVPIVQPYVKTSGSWAPVLNMWVKTSGSWELVFTGFTVELSPSTESGSGPDATVITTGYVEVAVTGGVGPFTYSWTQVSGDSISAISAAAYRTLFRATFMDPDETRIAVYKCTVTDTTTGLSEETGNVTITLTRTS